MLSLPSNLITLNLNQAKLLPSITPICVVAYAFTLLRDNLCRNSCIYLFIYLCTRGKRLSRGLYLACRLGSTSNRVYTSWVNAISAPRFLLHVTYTEVYHFTYYYTVVTPSLLSTDYLSLLLIFCP